MPQGNPKPGERYLHFKNKLYQIVCLAHHSENDERLVVYQALYGDFGICARPYDMFISEVDHEKYPEVTAKYRFTYVESENDLPFWAKEEKKTEVKTEPVVEEKVEMVLEKTPLEKLLDAKPGVRMVVEPKTVEEKIQLEPTKKAEVVFRENLPKEDRIVIKVDKVEHRVFEPVKEVPPVPVEPVVTEEQANPWLMKFLDAETFDEKYDVLGQMHRDVDDKLIDDIAVCMDVVIAQGSLQERYMQLKQCLRTKQKYEGARI